MHWRTFFLCLLLTACADVEGGADDAADEARASRTEAPEAGAPDSSRDGASGAPADNADPSENDTGADSGSDEPGASDDGAACTADNLDAAIDCQIAANASFVDAFCDCFTDQAFAGDRAECEASQPRATDFQPDACVRRAMESHEPAAVTNSLCYASAVRELADCMAVCPADEAAFDACFDAVGVAFDTCDTRVPESLTAAITACSAPADGGDVGGDPTDTPQTTPPDDDGNALRAQRDAWVATYCTCYGATEFGDAATCRAQMTSTWDPGLSSCEQQVMSAGADAGTTFGACLADTFLIAEVSCLECPEFGSIEYMLCSDPGPDVQFCFLEAPPALQDGLVECSR